MADSSAWRSAKELIESPDVDIVHICTPNIEHLGALRLAMAAQKHVYVDKPLVASLSETDELQKLLPAYRGVAQVVHQNRFLPAMLKARQLAEDGFLGRITGFRGMYLHSGSVDASRPMSWKFRASAGGGVIRNLGAHLLDLLAWLMGPFASVRCISRIWADQRPSAGGAEKVDTEDAAVMLLRSRDGAIGTAEVSKLATGAEDELRLEIHGNRGAMRFDLMQPNYLEVYDARLPEGEFGGRRGWQQIATVAKYPPPGGKFPPGKNSVGWLRGHVHCLHEFLRASPRTGPAAHR